MKQLAQGGCVFFIGAIAAWRALQIPPSAHNEVWSGLMPSLIAGGLFIVGGTLFVLGICHREYRSIIPWYRSLSLSINPRLIGLMLLGVMYYFTMMQFGYLLSTAIAAPCCLALYGVSRPSLILGGGVVVPVLFHIVFFEMLGVYPPIGEMFDLLLWSGHY